MDRERVLPDRDVLVENGIVRTITRGGSIKADGNATVVDGRGKFLMPGLVDSHAHPSSKEELTSYLAYGQTTIATLGGEGLDLRGKYGFAPNILTSGTTLDGTPPINRRFYSLASPEAAARVVDRQIAGGANFVKVYSKMKAPELRAVSAEAHRQNTIVVGHIPHGIDAETALAAIDLVAHGEEYFGLLKGDMSDAAIERLAALTKANGVSVNPNLVGYQEMPRQAAELPAQLAKDEVRYLSSEVYQEWLPANNRYATRPNIAQFVENSAKGLEVLKRLTAALHRHGVPLLAGSDSPVICLPGECLIDDIRLLAESGLTNFEALRAATANAGELWRRTRNSGPTRFGIVAPGARADLLLLSASPLRSLDALNDVGGVAVAGKWMTSAAIAAERRRSAPGVAADHAFVREYERLLTASDFDGIERLIRSSPANRERLNLNVVIFDALQLEEEGHRDSAIRLLHSATHLLGKRFGLWNVLGQLMLNAGDKAGAEAAFRRALALSPDNGVAESGLAEAAR